MARKVGSKGKARTTKAKATPKKVAKAQSTKTKNGAKKLSSTG